MHVYDRFGSSFHGHLFIVEVEGMVLMQFISERMIQFAHAGFGSRQLVRIPPPIQLPACVGEGGRGVGQCMCPNRHR